MKLVFLEEFGKAFVPKRMRPKIRKYLLKAGITKVPYNLFGAFFYVSIILTAMIYISLVHPYLVEKQVGVIIFLITVFMFWSFIQLSILLLTMVIIYIYLEQKIFIRTKKMEDVLQEFLRYVSENLKGGMSIDTALWDAIRPKFGILAHEIRLAAKKVMTGQDIEQALSEFTEKYDSPTLRRTFNLIIEGMKGGHEIADLIDRIEVNLRETKELKEEISATNTTYYIFLSIIALLIAPGLFALSYNLLAILETLGGKLGGAAGSNPNVPWNLSSLSIDPHNFVIFSVYALSVTSIFGAIIVSIIKRGAIRAGLKYIPLFITGSLVMYFLLRAVLLALFGSVIT